MILCKYLLNDYLKSLFSFLYKTNKPRWRSRLRGLVPVHEFHKKPAMIYSLQSPSFYSLMQLNQLKLTWVFAFRKSMSLRYMPGLAFPSLDIFRRRNFRLRFWKEHMRYTYQPFKQQGWVLYWGQNNSNAFSKKWRHRFC